MEDNELNREIAQTLLEMNGFSVDTAADGREAVERFCTGMPGRYDAILMDIRMQVIDSGSCTAFCSGPGRPDARSVPMIALSANAFDEDTRKSIASGMDGHLSKPIRIESASGGSGQLHQPEGSYMTNNHETEYLKYLPEGDEQ